MGVITTIDQLPSAPSALDGTEVTIAQTTTGETIQVTVQQLADLAAAVSGVASVNGFTGAVTLDAGDVGAVPAVTPAQPSAIDGDEVIVVQKGSAYVSVTASQIAALSSGAVSSVNGQTGAVTLDAGDVGAMPGVGYAGGQPSGLDGTELLVVQKGSAYVEVTTAQVGAVGGAGSGVSDPLFSGTPMDQIPPTANFGTLDALTNGLPVLAFDGGSTNEASRWIRQIPFGAAFASGITFTITCVMASATSGNVRFGVRVMRLNADLSVDSFDTAAEAHSAVSADADDPTTVTITLTTLDSATAGDWICVEIYRDASDTTNDTASGDAQLVHWHARSA